MLKILGAPSAAVLVACVAASACTSQVGVAPATGASGPSETRVSFARFPDLPLPSEAEINLDRTLVFGGSDTWIGRLVITASGDPNNMFDFFKQKLGGYGWQEITSVRAAVSVLTYTRQERVATIQIEGRTLRGSEVTITVSPLGAQVTPAAGPATGAPAREPKQK